MIKKKRVYIFFIKTLICIILFLVSAILSKRDEGWKNLIYNRVYEDNISFSYFKDFYNRYLGGIFPIENISNSQAVQVFNDELLYDNVVSYEEGIEVAVIDYYLVPVIEEGIVVYIGEKKKYGNVVIVEGNDGVDIWYGNMCNVNVKLYDSVENGVYLGEVCNDKLYLVFSDGNRYLNYEEYLN